MKEYRRALDVLLSSKWESTEIQVSHGNDLSSYTLKRRCGEGQTGVTWLGEDQFGREWAIKFVPRSEYVDHSLDAEVRRVARLRTIHVAQIHYFGTPAADSHPEFEQFYAIVVEWVPGTSLASFIEANTKSISIDTCMEITRGLCDAVAELKRFGLSHNDLHERNVMIVRPQSLTSGTESILVKVIDTGALKDEQRRLELLGRWNDELNALKRVEDGASNALASRIESLEATIEWFSRGDEEWIVYHICTLLNCLYARISSLEPGDRRFLSGIRSIVNLMLDPDPARRLGDPTRMYAEIVRLYDDSRYDKEPPMNSPFDLMSAELMRDDKHLMDLFSDKFPGLDTCRSNDPVYVYGPRGCGKSTVFRSLSMRTILQSRRPERGLQAVPFVGVYVSCTSELRSRFWLLSDDDFEALEPLIVRFFNLILIEELVRTLLSMVEYELDPRTSVHFGVATKAIDLAQLIRRRVGLLEGLAPYDEVSALQGVRWDIRSERETTWARILHRDGDLKLTDAQLIFDLCEEVADICPVFDQRRITFLLDDYSNQRIRPELQRRLNQAITFAKQGNPIFKVTSEYEGVDLTGIQEGREVREVNVGQRHTDVRRKGRHHFLQSVLQTRFTHLGVRTPIEDVLPPSGVGPSFPLARAIRKGVSNNSFRYHGIDTINDICSGDFATALDIVRRIFDGAGVDWRQPPTPIPEAVQHNAITRFAEGELQQVRYLSPWGQRKFAVVERLCWFARECVLYRDTKKDGQNVPLIKIHLDISESAVRGLRENSPENADVFDDLVRRGVLFPIDGSRDMEGHEGTRRFQIRRILLTRYPAPLGRHTAIRINDDQRLLHLVTEPKLFVENELGVDARGTEDLFDGPLPQ